MIDAIMNIIVTVILPILAVITVPAVFLLVVFIGFSVVFNFPKLRATSRRSPVIKSLDERVGKQAPFHYLPPDAPRGPADQLHTPELAEAAARRSS